MTVLTGNPSGPVLTLKTLQEGLKEFDRRARELEKEGPIAYIFSPTRMVIHPMHPHNFHLTSTTCKVCRYIQKTCRRAYRLRKNKPV